MDSACESNMPSRGRSFGHCIVSWGIRNYGRALWQKNLEIVTPEFCIKGPNSRDTKWKLILKTDSNRNSLVDELNVNVGFKEKDSKPAPEELSGTDMKSPLSDDKKEEIDVNPKPAPEELSETGMKSHLLEDKNEEIDVNSKPVPEELSETDVKSHLSDKNVLCLNENKNLDSRLSVKNVMFYLERSPSDKGPDRVCVDWKVYYIGIKGEKVSLVHDQHVFGRKIKYGFNIGILYDFEQDFEYNSGLTTILCDMIVPDTYSNKTFDDEISIDLYSLSEDLQWIFDRQTLCDTEIKVDGKSVKAHKAMLSSHTEFFEHVGEKGSSVEMSDMKYHEMLKILEYMYSHDPKYVIGKPSVYVYEAATQMKLRDLAAHYAPQEVKINTKIDVEKLTYQWVIKDFSKQTKRLSSCILKNNHNDTAWQINLDPKGIDGNSGYIALSVECIDGTISNDLCIQCAVLRNNEHLNCWKNLQNIEDNTLVQDAKFISKQDVLELLSDDCLRIGFKVRTCSGQESSIDYIPCTPVLYTLKKSFENMTRNLLSLRKSNKYTDVTFNFGKKEIKAHKFILSARSHVLNTKFKEPCNRIPIFNIRPETFEILLDYVYCATLNVSNSITAIDVYKAAEELLMPRLQEKCSRFLHNNVIVDNVMRIFMFANEHNDQYLKEKAKEFIEANVNRFNGQDLEDETGEVPRKDIVSAACKTKSTTITKYDDITIVSYDLELIERPLNKSVSRGKEICESSRDNITELKSVSGETLKESLEDLHGNEENKSLSETENPIVYYRDYSSKAAQCDNLSVPLKQNYGMEFADSNVKSKTNEQLQQDDEIKLVGNDSKGREIKENTSLKKEISLHTNEINESEQIKEKDLKELYQSMKLCLQSFKECSKELSADIANNQLSGSGQMPLDEQNGSSLKPDIDENELEKEIALLNAASSESHGNGQESLDEQNGSSLKSEVCQSESRKGFKLDTAKSELHGNGQETVDSGNGLQSNAENEADAALN